MLTVITNTITQMWDKTTNATKDQREFESKTNRRSKMKIERE